MRDPRFWRTQVSMRPLAPLTMVLLLASSACKVPGEDHEAHYNSIRYSGTAQGVMDEIAARDAFTVAFEITSNPDEWRDLLDAVAKGDTDWLQTAVKLYPGTSGNATDELTTAVRRALVTAPREALTHATRGWCINCLCDAPDHHQPLFATYRLAEAELERRIAAMKELEDDKLESIRQRCLLSLEASRARLKQAFGR